MISCTNETIRIKWLRMIKGILRGSVLGCVFIFKTFFNNIKRAALNIHSDDDNLNFIHQNVIIPLKWF